MIDRLMEVLEDNTAPAHHMRAHAQLDLRRSADVVHILKFDENKSGIYCIKDETRNVKVNLQIHSFGIAEARRR